MDVYEIKQIIEDLEERYAEETDADYKREIWNLLKTYYTALRIADKNACA